ncbi:hypothetical protein [Pseudomonas sp. NPDC087690]|uniref:hypothetical protein n=1 Tax=Pseudomonas sp. NPDC087690 TaxID=3364446 RepID=UPI00382CC6F7
MSKIVVAANAMIENSHKITDVLQGVHEGEIFFRYDQKYKWSILKRHDDHYALMFYPGRQRIEDLASMPDEYWHEFNEMVNYNSKDLGTKESLETFKDLYRVVNDMKYGMDQVLDEIISSVNF